MRSEEDKVELHKKLTLCRQYAGRLFRTNQRTLFANNLELPSAARSLAATKHSPLTAKGVRIDTYFQFGYVQTGLLQRRLRRTATL